MKINEIYKRFNVPPNLQEHMLRVWGIVCVIEKHWKGKENVDWELAKKMALLHDIGNIVKFDFDKRPEFLGDEQKNVEHWRKIQNEMIKKYGSDDHETTKKILLEMGIDQSIVNYIYEERFVNSSQIYQSENWPLKILKYADFRTLPFGIGTFDDRLKDIKKRYALKYVARGDFDELVSACRSVNKQIKENLDISDSEINDTSVNEVISSIHLPELAI